MTSLLRWDPVRELEDLGRRFSPVFGRLPQESRTEERQSMTAVDWAPVVDIAEDGEAYHLTIELPEVKREDVKVSIESGVLNVSGERKKVSEERNGKKYHRIERLYGTFLRSFSLPDDADPARVSATMKDGVLNVRIEKLAETKPRSVEIEVG
ncbi:MAG: Hsp20/alpha crystallin family protein [Leptospirales bacterium]